MWDITNIGISSLAAYKAALTITSSNISNANSPAYSRRAIDFSEGAFGAGVTIADVRRIFDSQADANVLATQSKVGFYESAVQQLQSLEKMMQGNSNIGKMINDSFTALQDLNRDTSVQNRSLYFSKLTNLVSQFKAIDSQMIAQEQNINNSLQAVVANVNQLLTNIGNINNLLANTPANSQNGLLDQRQGLLEQLSQFIDVTNTVDSNGVMTLSLSNGLPILVGSKASTLTTMTDPANPSNVLVALENGSTNMDLSNIIHGGQIGGYLSSRKNIYDAQHGLSRLAMDFTSALNAQNKMGLDSNGAWGAALFNDINSSTAQTQRVIANTNNTGSSTMGVSIDDIKLLSTSDYKLVMGASNSYVLTRLSDNTTVASGTVGALPQSISADGFTISISAGTFNANDEYLISPTRNAAADMALVTNDPNKLALAWAVTATNGVKQQGSTGEIKVTDITNPANSSFGTPGQLTPPIQIKFVMNGGVLSYDILDMTNPNSPVTIKSNIPYNSTTANVFPTSAPSSYDPGYTVLLSGTIQAGDTFNISYNDKLTSDNRNGVAIAELYNKGILEKGTASFSQAFNLMANDVATRSQSAEVNFESSDDLYKQAQDTRDSISGVSIEEEMMNLVRYQQSYQASAQIIQSAKSIFDIVIGMIR